MKSSSTAPSTRRARRWAVRLAAPVAFAVVIPTAVSAEPASRGQTVAGLQRRAAEVAAELNRLDLATNEMEEDYNTAALELASLREQLGDNQREVEAAQVALTGQQDAARSAAVRAFVGETDDDSIDVDTFDDMATDSRRRTYLTSVVGNSAQAIDDLGAAQQDLDDRRRRLEQATSKVDRQVAQLRSTQAELEAKIAERQQLRDSLDGQLKAAVEAERERQAAAQEARLAAEARAAAARQRNAERVRASAVVTATPMARGAAAPQLITAAAPPAAPAPAAPAPVATGSATPGGDQAVQVAMAQLGDRYRWGAVGPDSFDCSGLVTFAYRGIASLPRSSRAMRAATQRISEEQLLPGDLVFGGNPVHHVGIYIGNGQMVHSPQSGDVVKVSGIYRSSGPVSFGRI